MLFENNLIILHRGRIMFIKHVYLILKLNNFLFFISKKKLPLCSLKMKIKTELNIKEMEKNFNTKGIEFVPKNIVSDEAKLKLNKLMVEKSERLTKLVSDYKSTTLISQ